MTRSHRVLLNALLGLGIAWFCWMGAHVPWERADGDRSPYGGPRYDGRGDGGGGPFGRGDGVLQAVSVSWVAVPFLLLLAAGVALRWRWPRAAFVACAVGVGGFFGVTTFFGPVLLALALTTYPLAVTQPLRRWVGLLALLVPVVLAAHRGEAYLGALDPILYAELVMAVGLAVLPALVALLRRGRREALHRDREEDRRRTAYEERLRIAREVHDVVGHSLSVVTMQAGVALHVLDKQRAAGEPVSPEVTASLEAIRGSSRDALAELRTTLGVFRDPSGESRTPTAGLDRLDDLVGALRAAGRRIDVVHPPGQDQPPLPAAVDQAAFRIVQEGLTNVVRHAGEARATVRVEREPGALVVEVSDDGPGASRLEEGNGIRGMRERAASLGGTVSLAPGARGGFVLRADLPLVDLGSAVTS
ncbi:MAG: sensor histidine kinase [Janthinobacterium lividum]